MPRLASRGQSMSVRERLRAAINDVLAHSPSRFAIGVFVVLIAIFTTLFTLPISSSTGEMTAVHDAFFVAVSVICVTGLTTLDMAQHFSPFGNAMVYLGVNIGGVGVLTFASLLGFIIAGRLGLRAKLLAASDTNAARTHAGPVSERQAIRLGDIRGLLVTVALSAIVIELVTAVALFPSMLAAGYDTLESVWYSLYYSAMAFTNSGFTPNVGGTGVFMTDYWFQGVLLLAVFFGSLGFPVIFTIVRGFRTPRKWSLHVKMTLTVTTILLFAGAVLFLVVEWSNQSTIGKFNPIEAAFQALFISGMTRSGGFSMVDMSALSGASMLIASMLMFIGGGSASTAGGIKVTTFAVLLLAAVSEARGKKSMEAFGRRIPAEMLRLAVAVVLWGASIVAGSSILLMMVSDTSLERVLFETISAFATVGLSVGVTNELPPIGLYILGTTMFLGRVGTVTLAAAIAASETRQLFQLPEERPMVG